MSRESVRIANCSGFWGDRTSAARELLATAEFDVLTGDWLAELTMLIMQKQRARDPLKGYATTFLDIVAEVLATCQQRGVRIVANAGGVNPGGCAEALHELAARLGVPVRIGTVSGDDITAEAAGLAAGGKLLDADTGQPIVDVAGLLQAHAYLGGWGITSCLQAGADIVVTGRTTDAALVIGPAAWAFGWAPTDWDRLAGALVAGHVIECGGQATGGNFSFFTEVPRLAHIGFPIAELYPDGSSVITKPAGSGGAVTAETVTAQLLYEVGGPRYLNADVVARLDSVRLAPDGPDRIRISGVRGAPAPDHLKVSMAVTGGYRNAMTLVLTGLDIEAKAEAALATIWAEIPGGPDTYQDVDVSLIGQYGPLAVADPGRYGQAVTLLRIAVAGDDPDLVGRTFSSAVVATGLCSYPGFFMTTAPSRAAQFARYRPGLVEASRVRSVAAVDGQPVEVAEPPRQADDGPGPPTAPAGAPAAPAADGPAVRVPLGRLFGARSGDKGGNANVGFWARSEPAYRWLATELTTERLATLLPDQAYAGIERHALPNLRAVNFVIRGWLGDGVASSLRFDAQAKGLAEYLRAREVDVPPELVP